MSKNNRYSLDEIKCRISEKTIQGMSLKLDDLGAIGRVLSIQDDSYDEQFMDVFKALESQKKVNVQILDALTELKNDISDLKLKVGGLETKIGELTTKVNYTKSVVEELALEVGDIGTDVERLKKINSYTYIIIRMLITVATAVGICALMFG